MGPQADAAVMSSPPPRSSSSGNLGGKGASTSTTPIIDAAATTTGAATTANPPRKPGYYLRWSRLSKAVDARPRREGLVGNGGKLLSAAGAPIKSSNSGGGSGETDKAILRSVSGRAAPGEVLACMGPSGSGKTSLMNVLSGRSAYQAGTISIDGAAVGKSSTTTRTMKRFMADVAYVKQADIFFAHLTVRDQLTYTALLRMRQGNGNGQQQKEEVDRVLSLLRLRKVADSPIRMISGGERKRVNIGTELLTDPAVLLLDEPTSGAFLFVFGEPTSPLP
jgi:ABC-type lipoprotein export system ATPase subunit